jgi:hypothetical protein
MTREPSAPLAPSAPLTREDSASAQLTREQPVPTPAPAPAPAPLPWWWNASLIALGVAMALFRLIPTEADPDLWGHLRFGLDTIGHGEIVRPDIYSYLSGLPGAWPWINHEWLAEVIMAIAWNAAGGTGTGAAGLVAIKVALGLAIATVVCRHLIVRGVPLLGALLMTAYGIAVILPGLRSLRPQAFTYLAFALLLVWIHRASRGRVAWLALAPPLMAAWANLHGGFVAGLGVLGVWVMSDALRLRGRPSGALVIFGASVAATAITPYGWTLWLFLARTLGPRPEIAEWQGVSLVTIQGLAYLAVAGAGVTALFLTRRERLPIDIMLIACAVLLPFIAQRHLPLTVLIVLIFSGEHIASAAQVIVRRLTTRPSATPEPRERSDRFRPLVAAALLVEASLLLVLIARSPTTGQIPYNSAEYPVEAVARLADLAADRGRANVAVHFDWGEYVLWHAGPRVKVSMDGRRETVYSDAAYHDNTLFFDGVGEWDRLLARAPRALRAARGGTDLALVQTGTAVYHLMSMHPDWELVMESGPGALFGRRGSAVTSHVHAIPARALGGDTTLIFP